MSNYQIDANGAYINPAELTRIAETQSLPLPRQVKEALERAALEISRERTYIDQLQWLLDN